MTEQARDRLAWNVYWLSFAAFVVVFVLMLMTGGSRSPVWAVIIAVPVLAGAANLILFSRSHERVCAIEVGRHAWLRVLTMGGYSSGTFLITGIAELVLGAVLLAWILR